MTYEDGSAAYNQRDAGWMGANDAFHSDMDVADHQTAIVRYASGLAVSFHSNSHVSLQERRWYVAGTRGTLLADLVRNKLMIRLPALDRRRPERIDFPPPAPPTTTMAPTRPWLLICWRPCRASAPSR